MRIFAEFMVFGGFLDRLGSEALQVLGPSFLLFLAKGISFDQNQPQMLPA